PSTWPKVPFAGTKEELTAGLMASSKALEAKAISYDKKQLNQEVSYKTLKGITGISPVYQILMHVSNHGTYHRGQLVTMLREAGKTEIPATDLIAFYREKRK
ncbi:MAG: DinB family protein, partial [Chitinophagales bacterium]